MKTKEEFEKLVEGLTELEMTDLLEVCNDTINRNKWAELRDECIGDGNKIDELENENHELQESVDELESEKDEIEAKVVDALDSLVKGNTDKAKKILSEI